MIASIMFSLETKQQPGKLQTLQLNLRSFAKHHSHTRYGPHHCGSHHALSGMASQRLQIDTRKGQTNDDTRSHHSGGEHVPAGAESQGV